MSLLKSASLILLRGVSEATVAKSNYKVLMLRRIVETKSFSNKVVFPGGLLDCESDCGVRWLSLLHKHFSGPQLTALRCVNRESLYKDGTEALSAPSMAMMPEIFYRLCAIRETFEETGILLAIDHHKEKVTSSNKEMMKEIIKGGWQRRVSKEPGAFYELCDTFNICPALTSLSEWCLWITPVVSGISKRFRTVFFLSIVDNNNNKEEEEDEIRHNEEEAEEVYWDNPRDIIESYYSGRTPLAPPQVIEMLSFASLTFDEVGRISRHRLERGVPTYLPRLTRLSCGTKIMLLPGDCRYDTSDRDFAALSWKDVVKDVKRRRAVFDSEGLLRVHSDLD